MDLLVQAVVDALLQDVGIRVRVDFPDSGRVEGSSVLTEELNLFLSVIAGFVDGFATLANAFGEFFALGLDFGVKPLEDGQDLTFELFSSVAV